MADRPDEPTIPPLPRAVRRPLVAIWISLGLHAAVIALVQVGPPAAPGMGEAAIEARLTAWAPSAADAHAVPLDDTLPLPEAPPPEPGQPPAAAPAAARSDPSVAPSIAGAVDLTYYRTRELDVQPHALEAIEPAYPSGPDRDRISGTVRLQLKLEADGRVSEVEVMEADPPELFDASAVEAFRAARFSPAWKGGRPVRALMLIEVTYDRALPP